ncbi:MAG: sporulation protein YqfD, partial [Eubacteriales bacterium]|nr:sporulation protein YqfD [Eubacteriales bacterium]
WAKLCLLAGAGGWQLTQTQRRGPGPLAERLLRRPGILAGIGLFFVLLHWLGGFLWCMNLELLTVPQQESIRTLLAQSGIWEGCRPSQAELAQAQQLLEASGDFGWVSLNFTGGCLTAEGTPLQQAQAEPPAQNTGLYARAGGEVLAVNIASGFAQVQPGQYVGSGMLLAAAEKLDRSGAPVPQPASGTVTARVRLAYTGQQAFTQQRPVLTGAYTECRTLTLLGRSWPLPGSGALPEDVPPRVQWLPLRLGRLALPGCVQETTCWARETQEQTFTPETAAALARRSARLQLLQDFPDAVIESERDFASTTATAAVCRAVFVFCANIAEPRSAPAASG